MPRLQTVTSMLVLQQGQVYDASPYLTLQNCEQIGSSGSQSIALLLEPVEESPRSDEIAAELAERLIDEIHARRSQTTTAALLASIETVNALLVQLNAVRPPRERCHFGFTCVLTRGDEAYIAQAAPSQILIAQEGEIY